MKTFYTPALLAASLAGCGTPRPGVPAAQRPDSAVQQPAGTPLRSAETAPAAQAAPGLAGTWSLRVENRPPGGPRLELGIDSISGTSFRVRVSFLMQGDVGMDPERYEPTRGGLGADGLLHLTVKARGQSTPIGEIAGALAGDTIRLRTFQWAGDDQMAGGASWVLVKQRN